MTEPHAPELLEEIRAHFNEPVLTDEGVGRCIGYGEDKHDCYIIIRWPNQNSWKNTTWWTMVGGYYWLDRLKGQGHVKSLRGEDWDDYYRIDNFLELNGAPKEPEFIINIDHNDESAYEPPYVEKSDV